MIFHKPNAAVQAIDYQAMWNSMEIHPQHLAVIDATAKRLFASKTKFQELSVLTHVPWDVIAVIKERECGVDSLFDRNIANGQRWDERTTIVPKGRGPFKSWIAAGYDALVNCAPYASKWKNWTIGGTLTLLEEYNGEGYWEHGWANPYLWSYSNHYVRGKYASDGRYAPGLVDQEIGCAPLIARLYALDPTIALNPTPGDKANAS